MGGIAMEILTTFSCYDSLKCFTLIQCLIAGGKPSKWKLLKPVLVKDIQNYLEARLDGHMKTALASLSCSVDKEGS